ncbi:MAG: TetR family transcriptional regulator [Betaproteobacteria bacterium]|jgi:AcrR family transcriptional regulator|nr:TetR family transcriptional regulator [Betaproteobacteria bacterium]MBK6602425.1 TetR family transcriptional regulator [Betaproteobacteria bacterium]MBK7081365.1 TetR family transcriptional regulator [Betaproteobacteria bacterium]MBK7589772.1 TetR family transcriptional regulator [Betaproteobacteria bacterium]MBK7744748.1 TetR family transcriptional regulator [Betaproteobacteria bacterium]
MAIRQRAMQAEDKQERHAAILDAAERLLARGPQRVASVAEVADEAGLAKGTVYLYFASKEELLLAVHERAIDGFFRAVIAMVEQRAAIGIEDMQALTRAHIVEAPLFLPLAAHCFGMMAHGIAAETAVAFRLRMAQRLTRAGAGLERHFRQLTPGGGIALLRRSYALIMGLWLMSDAPGERGARPFGAEGAVAALAVAPFPVELDHALRALWQGTLGVAVAGPAG